DNDGGNDAGHVLEMRSWRDGSDQYEAIHAPVDHCVSDSSLGLFAVTTGAQKHLVLRISECVGEPVEDVREELVANVGQHHADGVRPAPHAARRCVRSVTQLLYGLADLIPHAPAGAV